jgi:iron complex outermembrane receptor protein
MNSRQWHWIWLCICISVTPVGAQQSLQPSSAPQQFALNIPPQPLEEALNSFGRQTHLKLAFYTDLVQGLISPRIAGTYTPEVALRLLLANTGLRFKYLDPDSVAILPNEPGANSPVISSPISPRLASGFGPGGAAPSAPGTGNTELGSDRFGSKTSDPSQSDKDRGHNTENERETDTNRHQISNLEEIIVTAQKREERLQDVPSSIEVLSGARLQEQGVEQLSDYVKQVPGLNIIGAAGPGQGEIVMRGISTGVDTSSLVGLYLDDVPFTPSSNRAFTSGLSFDPDLGEIERIEVLEGPQSTLYGASAMGGLVKFVTKQPDLNRFEGTFRVQGSQVDGAGAGYGVRGSLNIPVISDTVGLRASAFYRKDPGFVDNAYFGQKGINSAAIKGARISLRAKFSDTLETTFTGLLQNIDSTGQNLVYLNPNTLKPTLGRLAYSSTINQPNTVQYRSLSDTTSFSMPFATLTNIASYAHIVNDNYIDLGGYIGFIPVFASAPPGTGISYEALPNSTRYTDELRLASTPGRFEWLLGGFYTNEKDIVPNYGRGADSAGRILPPSSPYFNVYTYLNIAYFREKAIFGDLTYHLTDQFQGTLGARYSRNTQSFTTVTDGLLGINNVSGVSNDSAVTYLATVSYKPQSYLTVYARAASAYRPGGANFLTPVEVTAGVPPSFGPDKLWNYEGGIKGSLWDHRVTFTADIFHMRWTDVQLVVLTHGFSAEVNAASAKSDGAEASVEIIPLERLTLSLKGSYTNAKITANVPSIGAKDGDPLPYSPKVSGAALVDYRFAAFNSISPRAGLTYAYHGSQKTGYSDGTSYTLPSFDSLDIRAGFDWSNYSLIARVDNVANKFGVTSALPIYAPGFPFGGTVVRPRTFGLSLEGRF